MDKNKKLAGSISNGYVLMDETEFAKVEAIGNVLGGYLGLSNKQNVLKRSGRYPWGYSVPEINRVIQLRSSIGKMEVRP